jgi:diguanylate cyclase (GGDEF)-like protein
VGARESKERGVSAPLLRRALSPLSLTLAVIALVLAGAVAGLRALPTQSLLDAPSLLDRDALLLALIAAFLVAELGQALIELRNEAYSFSLTGVALTLGLLYFPPEHLVIARVGAAVLAFVLQRPPWIKCVFNAVNYLLDSVLVVLIAHALVGTHDGLDLRTALACYVAAATVDFLMSGVVLGVIRINDGPMTRQDVAAVLLPASAFVAINTALGFIFAVLLTADGLGVLLLAITAAVTAAAYRGYLVLRRRHRSLEVVQAFIDANDGQDSSGERATALLRRIGTLVRASRLELLVRWEDGRSEVWAARTDADVGRAGGGDGGVSSQSRTDGESRPGAPSSRPAGNDKARRLTDDVPQDLVLIGARTASHTGRAALRSPSARDLAHRAWLRRHGLRDAAVVRSSRNGASAVLVAADRLGGDSETFTRDDVALLQALTGHTLVAVSNSHLVEELRHDATHDGLTGLPNRRLISSRLQDAMTSTTVPLQRALPGCHTTGAPAVLLLDLNHFKEVNDTLGHHVGDELLRVVAQRIAGLTLPGATVARLGGDEFAILLPRTDEAQAVDAADQVTQVLRLPVRLADVTLSTAASIGVAVAAAGHVPGDLLRHADTAMYAAKREGVPVVLYERHLDEGRGERLALLADLHGALDRGELEVHYQPKVSLRDGRVESAEALVRWTHPVFGGLPPDQFIPVAESTGLIDRLTQFVLGTSLDQCRRWDEAGFPIGVAVNLSARNLLDPGLPGRIEALLARTGVAADRLTLEITESAVMGDPQRTMPILDAVRRIGAVLSLDDFGTGYSSLSYLQRLPVSEVKIDQSFVRGLADPCQRGWSTALIRCIVDLCATLDLRVVAEGVESGDIAEQLADLGCQTVQGYHISRPTCEEDFFRFLAAQRAVTAS